jgi:hypothetical protein
MDIEVEQVRLKDVHTRLSCLNRADSCGDSLGQGTENLTLHLERPRAGT